MKYRIVNPSPEEPSPPESAPAGRLKRRLMQIGVILGFVLVVFIGLIVTLYPQISDFVNTKNASRVIDIYDEALVALADMDYTVFLEEARAYNSRLIGGAVQDAFSNNGEEDRSGEYWKLLDISGNGMMGYIEIELLDIRLPLYHGVSETVLAQGVGHIQGSSLPVGGEGTHAVVSAHTGLPRAKLFTGVDTLVVGDSFTLSVLGERLTYEVDRILTVLPHEVDALAIEAGEDFVTLVTCTPYGINSHRLLVRGTRVATPEPEAVQTAPEETDTDAITIVDEPSGFQAAMQTIVEAFSYIVEGAAEGLVRLTEWGMDLFGVAY